jgi:hypothetical protein
MDWMLDLLTPLGNTSNYSVTADLHTLEITVADTKSFPTQSVFNSRSLATVFDSGDASASRSHVFPSPTLFQIYLPAVLSAELGHHFALVI